jgi:hypothetical protein
MRRVIVTTLLTVFAGLVAAQECGYNGMDFYSIPTTTLMIPQQAPSNPGLNGNKYWQVALCSPQPFAACSPGTQPGNIIEINGAQTSCDSNFIAPASTATTTWTSMYGGINAIFYGQYSKPNDRVANVTVYCDPNTPTIAAHSPTVLAYPSPSNPSVWNFNIELKSTYACGGNPPGPTPNPPGPNTPNPPGPNTPSPGTPSPWTPITPHPPPPGPEPPKPKESESPVAIVFVVLVFVLPAIYVGIFVGLNYKNGKRGRELLPHPEFWRDFPWLIVDGFKFTKNKFMQCIKKGDGNGEYGPYNGGGEATYKNVS